VRLHQQRVIWMKKAFWIRALRVQNVACKLLVGLFLIPLSFAAESVLPNPSGVTRQASPSPNLPTLGDEDAQDFSVSAERQVGAQIMRDIRQDPDYSDDPQLLDYLQSIWSPLITQARRGHQLDETLATRLAWEVFLVRDASVNAFALPGGYVGVHLGLIEVTQSRDELASVLAHEMSHITQRHIARQITQNRRQTLVNTAAMILGVLVASRANSADGVNAAIAGGQAATLQGQLNFSRDMEREADRVGFAVLSGAGFAPSGMAHMFERLAQASRLNDNGAFPYLRSHPLTTERIGEVRARLGVASSQRLPVAAPSIAHALARARARVLMDVRAVALRRWQGGADTAALIKNSPASAGAAHQALAVLYQHALAASLLRDFNRADAVLHAVDDRLHVLPADDAATARRTFDLLAVQSFLDRGDAPQAARLLQAYVRDRSRPLTFFRAQLALAAGDASSLKSQADVLQAWAVLAQVWSSLGQPLRALRAEAESRYALGDINGAIDRARQAQRLSGSKTDRAAPDALEMSVIATRLKTWEIERRDQLRSEAKSS
jgi:beta-barrel assembly-enhancing protease